MKKSLLVGLMALSTSLSGYAFEAGEYVYAPQGRFKISSSDNLCTNSTCASNFDGWTAISATAETTPDQVFSYDPEKGSFSSMTNVAGVGMYYKFNVPNNSGAYVVSFKIRQATLAWPFSTNIHTRTTDNVNTYGYDAADRNFVSVFGNTGGYTSNTDFLACGAPQMLTSDWKTVSFAIVGDGTSRDWYIAFQGMNTGVEISDVQIQEASQVADLRKRDKVLQFVNSIIKAKEWPESDEYLGVKETVEMLNSITDDSSVADLNNALIAMDEAMSTPDKLGFLDIHMDDYLASCASGTKWAERIVQERNGTTKIGDWQLVGNPLRWGHCWNLSKIKDDNEKKETAKALLYGNYGYSAGTIAGPNYCKMIKVLNPGTYVFAVDGSAHTQYSGYDGNFGYETGEMRLYIKPTAEGAKDFVSNAIALPACDMLEYDKYAQNVIAFKVTEKGEYEIGIEVSQPAREGYTLGNLGGNMYLANPRLYCSLDGYNADQLAYIEKVRTQINAAANAYASAEALRDSVELPWLKKEMADTMAVMKPRVDFYNALTDEEIINGFVDPVSGVANNGYADMTAGVDLETGNPIPTYNAADSIMNNGVRPMQYFNNTYTKVNSIFVNLNTSIDLAKQALPLPIYSTATGSSALNSAITTAEALYKDMAANGSYVLNGGEEVNVDSVAVVNSKVTLDEAVVAFKASIPAENITTIVDIDFSGDAVLDEATSLYSIAGNKGSMAFSYFKTETPTEAKDLPFEKGFDSNGEKVSADVLRVGNGTGTVVVDPAEYAGGVVRVSFDYYFIRLSDKYTGFYLNDENGANVAGLWFTPYSWSATYNPFGFDLGKFVGTTSDNLGSLTEANKTSFELVLDYVNKTMYASTASPNGTQVTKTVPFSGDFTSFIVQSNYANFNGRRSWFDNLKIERIAVDPNSVDGVKEVTESADEAIYNVAGQKVSAPVKGQIYVKKGAAFVK